MSLTLAISAVLIRHFWLAVTFVNYFILLTTEAQHFCYVFLVTTYMAAIDSSKTVGTVGDAVRRRHAFNPIVGGEGGGGASEAPQVFFACRCQTAGDGKLKLSDFQGTFIADIL